MQAQLVAFTTLTSYGTNPGFTRVTASHGLSLPFTALHGHSASRNQIDPDHYEADTDHTLRTNGFPEQKVRRNGVDYVSDRQHRIGDADFHARESHDPDDQADDVARDPAQDEWLSCQLPSHRQDVRSAELEMPDYVR